MGLLALLIALLLEQAKPIPDNSRVELAFRRTAQLADDWLHAGMQRRYGLFGWLLVTGSWVFIVWLIWQSALWLLGPLGGFVSIAVLYGTLRFREFSQYFTDIQLSLNQGNEEKARELLTAWKKEADPHYVAGKISTDEIIRQSIEHALLTAQRHVFGVIFWYLLLPGPIGPVLYRVSEFLSRNWNQGPEHEGLVFGWAAQRIQQWLDWIPARLTALSFAAAGNFEEATMVWRTEADKDSDPTRGILLSAGLGALGLRPNYPKRASEPAAYPVTMVADTSTLAAVVGLIWRSLLLWMGVTLLVTIAGLLR